MKRFIQVLALATASVLALNSAFAETQPRQQQPSHSAQHSSNHQSKSSQSSSKQKKAPKPSQDWKVGHKVPSGYRGKAYQVDYKKHRLSAPKKGQKWLKINGEYVLVKSSNHQIVKFNGR